MAINEINS